MNEKQKFIISELWILAWAASVQRAKLYQEGVDSLSKEAIKFREDIMEFAEKNLISQYADGCTEEQHYENIEKLIAFATKTNPGILGKDGYKYGVAQKLLNLALKYHWCLDLIKDPPHCPVDRIVINKTKFKNKINWTQITQRQQYQQVIEAIKVAAKTDSIAKWELESYRRR